MNLACLIMMPVRYDMYRAQRAARNRPRPPRRPMRQSTKIVLALVVLVWVLYNWTHQKPQSNFPQRVTPLPMVSWETDHYWHNRSHAVSTSSATDCTTCDLEIQLLLKGEK